MKMPRIAQDEMRNSLLFCLALAMSAPAAAQAQKTAAVPAKRALTYADLADLTLAAQVAAAVRIRTAQRLKGTQAGSALPGRRRFLMTADVLALLRGKESIPPRIAYLIDVAPDAAGKFPKLAKGEAIAFALPVAGFPGEVRLVSPDGQIAASPDNLARVRAILKEAEGPDAPPVITAVGDAFHVEGNLPGEGETQIFLESADGRPVSLSILRVPNKPPLWSVAFGEVVDQGAEPPRRNTLTWYRLACALPATLPDASTASLEPDKARLAREDYAAVITGLGACPRSLAIRPGT